MTGNRPGGAEAADAGADAAADLLARAWVGYRARFDAITARAPVRFAARDWHGAHRDATDRLLLYGRRVGLTVQRMNELLGASARDEPTWHRIREAFAVRVADFPDAELARTFHNSVSRRVLGTVGVARGAEFTEARQLPSRRTGQPVYRRYSVGGDLAGTMRRVLLDMVPQGWAALERDVQRAAGAVEQQAAVEWPGGEPDTLEILPALFYRNKGSYLVGRLRLGHSLIPMVMALLHEPEGVMADAVLTTSDEVSVVFGFSWSYFQVTVPRPAPVIDFLGSIMPLKRRDELYNAIGHNKHGKTELYRALVRHLEAPAARFEPAEGEEGMVMTVFTLPSLNVVFKIIKDRFAHPKRTTRDAVRQKYQLVFVRDRAGRLADAQEFEGLAFRKACFAPELLERLLQDAGSSVRIEGDRVVVRHLYTERRVEPLNIYLQKAPAEAARAAVLDYGRAIKDLAAANIFTGDMLRKNFGVTRHGRVIFYDYDELALLTDCHFRRLPQPIHPEDEFAAEPWFSVGEQDVFPEEFGPFLLPPGGLKQPFLAAHADLLSLEWWESVQTRVAAGELVDVFPYPPDRRFPRAVTRPG